ncbi:MAG: thiamine pyrophosphate-binding protein [Bacteroidales bacterium]|jgi:acetolactate synthase-1/2/3 large subunit|nr:thiamine pyrophosphate-binding protein [Bacteroidales bacterium]
MRVKVAKYIADFFALRGVEHVFTVTGGGAMHLNDAFGHHDTLRCVYNHHEQACAIAAEGYTRLSGKIAAVCVTSGPGGTNALTGVVGAWLDSIPMFVISGQVKRETTIHAANVPQGLRQLGDQEFDIVSCVSSMTKYAVQVWNADEIRYHLEKAWYLALNGRGGPVWLDIPLDIQAATIETDGLCGFEDSNKINENPLYDTEQTQRIIEKLTNAKRPVLMLGTGVRFSGAHKEVLLLAEKLQIPVVTAWNAHDLISDENPLYCGRPGTVGLRGGNFVVQNCDLLIVLGCRLNIRQISYNYAAFASNAYKIIVDIDKQELQKPTVHADMPIHANIKDVVDDMLQHLEELPVISVEWLEWCKNVHEKYPAVLPFYYNSEMLNPYVFVKEFTQGLREDDTIICGNGSACVITFQAGVIKKNTRLFTNSGCAAMGYGFPAAIGCCFARNDNKRVICFDGDGSFQMNMQELQVLAHHGLNLKLIYINNNGYHSIRQTQMNLFQAPLVGVEASSGISFPDAEKIASAYGIPFIRVRNKDDIDTLLKFIDKDGPAFCEIVVDTTQNFEPKLSSKVLPDGKIISPSIDDMFPFLSREEYESIEKSLPL